MPRCAGPLAPRRAPREYQRYANIIFSYVNGLYPALLNSQLNSAVLPAAEGDPDDDDDVNGIDT